jgi:hypothetical protein
VKARIERLDQLARRLSEEVRLQKGADDVLLFRERKRHPRAVQDALARRRGGAGGAGGGGEADGGLNGTVQVPLARVGLSNRNNVRGRGQPQGLTWADLSTPSLA